MNNYDFSSTCAPFDKLRILGRAGGGDWDIVRQYMEVGGETRVDKLGGRPLNRCYGRGQTEEVGLLQWRDGQRL